MFHRLLLALALTSAAACMPLSARDLDGNVYVFQLRDATAAHAPADLNAVKDKVENHSAASSCVGAETNMAMQCCKPCAKSFLSTMYLPFGAARLVRVINSQSCVYACRVGASITMRSPSRVLN